MENGLSKLLMECYASEVEPSCEKAPKAHISAEEQKATELFLYLSGQFDARQFDDFY